MKQQEVQEDKSKEAMQTVTMAPSCIVGIGASAGGLEATAELLENLPIDMGMSFVIIQHLSPDYKSMLNEILGRHTKMPVLQIDDGMPIEKNRVYVIPPKNYLLLENGCFSLEEYSEDKKRLNHPVDVFFKSLASHEQRRSVVVVLSGTGSDGTAGAKEVREAGGLVLVQTPESAKFNGMPLSVIQAGVADKILAPADIAEELTHISTTMSGVVQVATDKELLSKVFTIIKNRCNIDFTYYKNSTVMRRIQRRMVINHMDTINDYINFLGASYTECEAMSKEMLIGVTSFFRDPESFRVLKENVVKPLIENAKINNPIRVWVPGCSTGEEAYSLAILFIEAMEELERNAEIKIFATDLDERSVAIAAAGEYGESITENLSATRLGHFFLRKNGKYVVSRDLRKMIVFAQQNILQDPPFGKLDLVSCRNMLIYFQTSLQKKIIETFNLVLNPNGYLFLGSAETIGSEANGFKDLFPGERIYQHSNDRAPRMDAYLKTSVLPVVHNRLLPTNDVMIPIQSEENNKVQMDVLERFLPATFIVDEHNKLLHTFGDCSNYLHVPTGKMEMDVYSMLTEALRIPTSNIVQQTRDDQKSITYTDINIQGERSIEKVTLTTTLLNNPEAEGDLQLISITIANSAAYEAPEEAISYNSDVASSRRITDLESELSKTKTKLKSTVAELESVNEELQAANEELLTSNEELQSSNEELQSVNEELYTVNAEFQQKLKEVTSLNDDIAFFLSSAFVGVIFLDKELRIRRYTSFINEAFSVVEQDVGRSIQCISYNFPKVDLMGMIHTVLQKNKAKDFDIISVSEKSYLVRIAPFITQEEKQDGVVLTFIDTTERMLSDNEKTDLVNALMNEKAANRDKDNFLSRVSHDMRSPLHEITGLLELTQRIKGLPEEAVENMDEMLGSAQYLLGIINDTVEVGKIKNKGVTLNRSEVFIEKMLKHVYSIMRFQAENANILLSQDLSEAGNYVVEMDENHMMQVLVNLIGNAIKYTQPGGKVDFSAKSQLLGHHKVRCTYVISDNGVGMSKKFQEKMFGAFEQEGKDTGKQGTGLGLYIVKQLVDAMGGTIFCNSAKDEGTTFRVTIEYDVVKTDGTKPAELAKAVIDNQALKGRHVLVCDDHPINVKIAERMLITAGATCDNACNGKVGLGKFLNSPFGFYDAILMDVRMPVMDGIQATHAIRCEARRDAKTIPIIAMTADAFGEDRELGMQMGLTDYITKPTSLETLIETIKRSLASKID